MASLRLDILGHGIMVREGVAAVQNLSREIVRRLPVEGVRLMDLMKDRVPVLSGKLKKTGSVSRPHTSGNETIVVLSFGDVTGDVDYAIEVHERLNVRHANGRAKFMESVVQEEYGSIAKNLTRGVK